MRFIKKHSSCESHLVKCIAQKLILASSLHTSRQILESLLRLYNEELAEIVTWILKMVLFRFYILSRC